MIFAVTGASGFIGHHLIDRLQADGHSVRTLSRHETGIPGTEHFEWDAVDDEPPPEPFEGADVIFHLAGEPVAQRWTGNVKRRIRDSRIQGTRYLVDALGDVSKKPHTLIAASAIGYYGNRGEEILTESSANGHDFLSDVCIHWEEEAKRAARLGLRVVNMRFGIVLGRDGGALKKMLIPFKAGLGGPVGSGMQWVSWIHIDDLIELLMFAVANTRLEGPVNATAPRPIRNTEFAHALGHTLHRPSLTPVPVFGLKMMFGQGADALLASQRVVPDVATRAGFAFRYSEVRSALKQLLL